MNLFESSWVASWTDQSWHKFEQQKKTSNFSQIWKEVTHLTILVKSPSDIDERSQETSNWSCCSQSKKIYWFYHLFHPWKKEILEERYRFHWWTLRACNPWLQLQLIDTKSENYSDRVLWRLSDWRKSEQIGMRMKNWGWGKLGWTPFTSHCFKLGVLDGTPILQGWKERKESTSSFFRSKPSRLTDSASRLASLIPCIFLEYFLLQYKRTSNNRSRPIP